MIEISLANIIQIYTQLARVAIYPLYCLLLRPLQPQDTWTNFGLSRTVLGFWHLVFEAQPIKVAVENGLVRIILVSLKIIFSR